MQVKFGSIITDGSGKLGGMVIQGNNGRKSLRISNFKSNHQAYGNRLINKAVGVASQKWRSLSASQRKSYSKFASRIFNNNNLHPSGYSAYMAMMSLFAPVNPAFSYISPSSKVLVNPVNPYLQLNKTAYNFLLQYSKIPTNPLHISLYASLPSSCSRIACTLRTKLCTYWFSVQNPPFNFYSAYLNFISPSVAVGQYIRIKAVFYYNFNPFKPFILDQVLQVS